MGGSIYNYGLQFGKSHGFVGTEEWYRRAAEGDDPEAMRFLGDLLGEKGDSAGQEEWLRKAAEAGDVPAMLSLSALLEARGAVAEAAEWRAKGTGADGAKGQPESLPPDESSARGG